MTMPKTLMQMAGVESGPPPIDHSVLVLIDCQREYVDGGLPLAGIDAALVEASRVLDFARRHGVPVIHVQHRGRAGGFFDPGTPAYDFADAVTPLASEVRIEKGLPNSFAGTDLQSVIDGTGRKHLIVVGFMTHMCVSTTVRASLDLGYTATIVASACATRDLPDGAGGVVPADVLHRAELAALADRFATVLPNAAALTTP
ncbi:MAG: cysteine hydrolase [Rhodospirillales bacterium]|nr:cysteine hydrolase [Rhodospirillales bacterium]